MKQTQHNSLPDTMSALRNKLSQIENRSQLNELSPSGAKLLAPAGAVRRSEPFIPVAFGGAGKAEPFIGKGAKATTAAEKGAAAGEKGAANAATGAKGIAAKLKALPLKKSLALVVAGTLGYLFGEKAIEKLKDLTGSSDSGISAKASNDIIIPQPASQGEPGDNVNDIIDQMKVVMQDLSNYNDSRIPPAFAEAVKVVGDVAKERVAEIAAIKPKK